MTSHFNKRGHIDFSTLAYAHCGEIVEPIKYAKMLVPTQLVEWFFFDPYPSLSLDSLLKTRSVSYNIEKYISLDGDL